MVLDGGGWWRMVVDGGRWWWTVVHGDVAPETHLLRGRALGLTGHLESLRHRRPRRVGCAQSTALRHRGRLHRPHARHTRRAALRTAAAAAAHTDGRETALASHHRIAAEAAEAAGPPRRACTRCADADARRRTDARHATHTAHPRNAAHARLVAHTHARRARGTTRDTRGVAGLVNRHVAVAVARALLLRRLHGALYLINELAAVVVGGTEW